jgi:hypothetical protein
MIIWAVCVWNVEEFQYKRGYPVPRAFFKTKEGALNSLKQMVINRNLHINDMEEGDEDIQEIHKTEPVKMSCFDLDVFETHKWDSACFANSDDYQIQYWIEKFVLYE